MKGLTFASAAALLLTLSYVSLSADAPAPDRPAGVAAEDWVVVSDRLGIVLVSTPPGAASNAPMAEIDGSGTLIDRRNPLSSATGGTRVPLPSGQSLLLKPPVGGYFMVKGAGGWTRLVVFEPIKGPGDAG